MKLQGTARTESIWVIAPQTLHASCDVRRAVSAFGQLIRAETEDGWGEKESPVLLNHQCRFQELPGHPHRLPGQGLSEHEAGELADYQRVAGPVES